jgi:hypothetical protein
MTLKASSGTVSWAVASDGSLTPGEVILSNVRRVYEENILTMSLKSLKETF